MNKFDLIKVIVFSLVLATLLYPGLEKLYLYRQTYILEDLVMAPLAFLGENQTILSNDDKFTRYGTNYKSLDLVRGNDLYIGIKNEFKFHEKWVNLSEEKNRVFNEGWFDLTNFRTKLLNNEYSAIIYGPQDTESDIYYVAKSNLDNYCELFLPSAEHKCNDCKTYIRVFLKDNESCSQVLFKIRDYYSKNFVKVCREDEMFADFNLKISLVFNDFQIVDNCKNGGRLLINYHDKVFRFKDLLNLFFITFLIFIVLTFKKKLRLFLVLIIILLMQFGHIYERDRFYENVLDFLAQSSNGVSQQEFAALEDLESGKNIYPENTRAAEIKPVDFHRVNSRYGR